MSYRFPLMDSGLAYINNNLVLPKTGINLKPLKAALTFMYGEEEYFDEDTGALLGTRPGKLRLWDENKHHLIVPREFIGPKHYKDFGFDFLNIQPVEYPEVDIQDNIILRDAAQEEAFEALLTNNSGTLNLSCGKGKTVLGLKLTATLQVPTLIVVNTTALLEQWKEEVVNFLGLDSVGVIQGKQFDWKHPVVLCMVHTLSLYRDQWPMSFRRHFGLVIYDEGHHMSAPVFVRSADLFFGRRYSLTATATRTDGLQAVYQYHLGRVIHSNLSQDLIPMTYFYRLKWEFDERYKYQVVDSNNEVNLPRVRTYLGEQTWRNNLIVDYILKDLEQGRNLLVLSHSVAHIDRLSDMLSGMPGFTHSVITGTTAQESRMNFLRDGNPVLGTFQLAREGLNKPSLDTLYILTPFSNANDRQQAWGRIQRIYENKFPPVVRVFEDLAFTCSERSNRALRGHLRDAGYPYNIKRIKVEI